MSPHRWRRSLGEPLFAVFLPAECRLCGQTLAEITAAPVCPSCLVSLSRSQHRFTCSRCGLPFETPSPLHGMDLCGICRLSPQAFDAARSFGAYEGDLRRLIHLFKYERMEPLARPLAEWMAALRTELPPADVIVAVPLHRWRLWQRGFNQSGALAQELARRTGLPYLGRTLRRVKPTLPQVGLSHRQRKLNLQNAFAVRGANRLRGRRVLLVDDVMTTGATLDACARVLKAAGAVSVAALTAARAKRRITEWVDDRKKSVRAPVTRRENV